MGGYGGTPSRQHPNLEACFDQGSTEDVTSPLPWSKTGS
jgi:hypothetical protein